MITHIDHLVLTVRSLEETCGFYQRVLGFERVDVNGKTSLKFGQCKFNIHQAGHTFEPKAMLPTPGSADFCLITDEPIDAWKARLREEGVWVELGPVERNGAQGLMDSLYFRDPDANLIEVSRYK